MSLSPDILDLLRPGVPAAGDRFGGLPRYNFISGHNDRDQIPVALLRAAADRALTAEGPNLALYNLGYGPAGYPPLRAAVADRLNRARGTAISADDVIITSGSTQGIDLVNRIFLAPGDTVLVEEFAYSGAIRRAEKAGTTVIPLPLDDGGIDLDVLERTLADLAARGIRPKYIYTIPTVQNPTGTIMSLERRHRLLDLARRYKVLVFEDECYADLYFDTAPPPSLYALDPGQVVHVGSFSKTLAPALRIGFVVGDWQLLGRMLAVKADSGSGALEQVIMADFLSGAFDAHVETLRHALAHKAGVMVSALEREFGTAIDILRPAGGIFVWLRFPEGVDTARLLAPAKKAGVVFNAGGEWAVRAADGSRYMRLCFALPSTDDIRDGIAALARVCHAEIGLPVHGDNRVRG